MTYAILIILDSLAILVAIWGIKGSIIKTENKALALYFLTVWTVITLALCFLVSPFLVLLPLLPHIPTLVIGQFMNIPTKGSYILFADMGVNAAFLIVFGYIVVAINGVVLS